MRLIVTILQCNIPDIVNDDPDKPGRDKGSHMFMDVGEPGGPGGEPHYETCHSCKRLIPPGHPQAEVRFDGNDEKLASLSGIYHAECAKPILSVKRALDMMKRVAGGF